MQKLTILTLVLVLAASCSHKGAIKAEQIINQTDTMMKYTPYKSFDVDAFANVIKDTTVTRLDVRTAEEFAEGHLVGAINMDVQKDDFGTMIQNLDKSRPVAVYCRSGRRSLTACEILANAGFTVYNLEGGYLAWSGSGMLVEDSVEN